MTGKRTQGLGRLRGLRMLVTPLAWSTAAVARIIKNAMTLENTTPTLVSKAMRLISDSPPRDSSFKKRRSFKTAPAGWQDDTRVAIAHF